MRLYPNPGPHSDLNPNSNPNQASAEAAKPTGEGLPFRLELEEVALTLTQPLGPDPTLAPKL